MYELIYEEAAKKTHYIKSFISIFLVAVTLFTLCFKTFADAQNVQEYVCEVRYCQKSNDEEAKSWLTNNGYRVVNKNLNEGGRGGVVYMGYKTTTNKYNAITDIAYMQENGGYEMMDYRDYIASNASTFSDITDELVTAGKEIRNNVENGNRVAAAALDALNLLVMEKDDTQDSNQTGFGDWLIDPSVKDMTKKAEITNMLALCNPNLISFIYGQIALGTSCDTDYSWVRELSDIGRSMQPEYASDQEGFIQSARQLIPALQGFAQSYNAMERRREANGGELKISKDMADLEDAKASEISEIEETGIGNQQQGLTVAEGEQQVDTPTEESLKNSDLIAADVNDGDLVTYTLYQKLAEIPFEDRNVGDYLIELGERNVDLTDADEAYQYYRDIFPIVYVLTPGQFAAIHMDGLNKVIAFDLDHTSETISRTLAKIEETGKELLEANNGHRLSVWFDVDKSLYESKVGVTSQQRRKNAASGLKTLKDRTTQNYDALNKALKIIDGSAMAASIIALSIGIGVKIAKTLAAKSLAAAIAAGTIAAGATSGVSTGIAVASIASTVFNIISIVLIVATIVIDIVLALLKRRDQAAYDNPNHDEIPLLMYDYVDKYTAKYEVCKNQDGKPADLNAGNCKYWSAPYFTRSMDAGDPIIVPSDNSDVFKVQVTDTSVPNGFKPVHYFEEGIAGNTNRGTHDETTNPEIFVFAYTGTTYQTGEVSNGKTEYISDLRVFTGDNYTVEKAKAEAYKTGFTLIEINLTPEDGNTANYLGYKTSTGTAQTVRDIRVGPATIAENYTHGSVSYGKAGVISNSAGLYFTYDDKMGSPIKKEDLRIFRSHKDVPEGFEPVNAFSGGGAFNLAASARCDGKYLFTNTNTSVDTPYELVHEWNEQNSRYLYFKPEEAYTSSNSVKYISGFVYLTASVRLDGPLNKADDFARNSAAVDNRLNELAKELNVTIIDESKYIEGVGEHYFNTIDYDRGCNNLTGNAPFSKSVLAYSTTYNPKRAVYDVKFYKMGDKAKGCLASISSNGTVYSVCEHEYKMAEVYFEPVERGTFITSRVTRYYSNEHGLISRPYRVSSEYQEKINEIPHIGKLDDRSLYVAGFDEKGTPIKEKDIIYSNSSSAPEGMISVRNIGEYTGSKPVNIASDYSQNEFYMYMKGTANEKGKYIENIYVGYSESDENGLGLDFAKTSAGIGKGVDVLPYNLCNKDGGKDKANGDHAAYIGVTRTNDMQAAISSIVIIPEPYCTTVSSSNKRTPVTTYTVNNIEYHLAEGMSESGPIISAEHNDGGSLAHEEYYIYYCRGASDGAPISDIVVDKYPFLEGCTTVSNCINGFETDLGIFMHTRALSDGEIPAYISQIGIFEGDTLSIAVRKAIAAGFNYVIANNLNPGLKIGWENNWETVYTPQLLSDMQRAAFDINVGKFKKNTMPPLYKYKVLAYKRTAYAKNAIRNIYATYGEPANPAGDDFEYYQTEIVKLRKRELSAKQPVKYNLVDNDLNTHRYAGQVFLYYTKHNEGYDHFETVKGKNVGVFSYAGDERAPITDIAVHNVGSEYSGNKDVHFVCNPRTKEKQDINQGRSILIDGNYIAHDARCYIIFSRSSDEEGISLSDRHIYVDEENPIKEMELTDGRTGASGHFDNNEGYNGKDELFDIDYSKLMLIQAYDGDGGDF